MLSRREILLPSSLTKPSIRLVASPWRCEGLEPLESACAPEPRRDVCPRPDPACAPEARGLDGRCELLSRPRQSAAEAGYRRSDCSEHKPALGPLDAPPGESTRCLLSLFLFLALTFSRLG